MSQKSMHSICRWTFNPGKGGFVPGDMRPAWNGDSLGTPDMVKLVGEKIAPRMPDNVELGLEVHYNDEINEDNAAATADALADADGEIITVIQKIVADSRDCGNGRSKATGQGGRQGKNLGRTAAQGLETVEVEIRGQLGVDGRESRAHRFTDLLHDLIDFAGAQSTPRRGRILNLGVVRRNLDTQHLGAGTIAGHAFGRHRKGDPDFSVNRLWHLLGRGIGDVVRP